MKYRNLAVIFLLGVLLLLRAWTPAVAGADSKTVLLRVHVPFAGG